MPVGGADRAGFLCVLKRLNQPQCFIHAAPDGQVVDGGMLNHALVVDEEQPAQGHAVFENAVLGGDFLVDVGEQRKFDLADSTGSTAGFCQARCVYSLSIETP